MRLCTCEHSSYGSAGRICDKYQILVHCLNGPLRLGSHVKVDKRATIDPSESGPRLNIGWEVLTKRLLKECQTVLGARSCPIFCNVHQQTTNIVTSRKRVFSL